MSKERDLFRAIVIGGLGLGANLAACSCDTPATADADVRADAAVPADAPAVVADAHVEAPDAHADDAGPIDAAVDDAGMVLII